MMVRVQQYHYVGNETADKIAHALLLLDEMNITPKGINKQMIFMPQFFFELSKEQMQDLPIKARPLYAETKEEEEVLKICYVKQFHSYVVSTSPEKVEKIVGDKKVKVCMAKKRKVE